MEHLPLDDSHKPTEQTNSDTPVHPSDFEHANADPLALFRDTIMQGDCLRLLPCLPDKSVDMILADLPYQVTAQNAWDKMIPIEPLWQQYRRVIKDNGAIILTGQGQFSAKMIMAAEDIYRYSLVWHKNKATGHLNAKKQPMRAHEDIMVFYKRSPVYHPQMTEGHEPLHYARNTNSGTNYGKTKGSVSDSKTTLRYPTSVLSIPVINNDDPAKVHPTQKPIELAAWLIRTYTNPGDFVLDNVCGSGAFMVAAKQEGRHFIGMEADPGYAAYAQERINSTPPLLTFTDFEQPDETACDDGDVETELELVNCSSTHYAESSIDVENDESKTVPGASE